MPVWWWTRKHKKLERGGLIPFPGKSALAFQEFVPDAEYEVRHMDRNGEDNMDTFQDRILRAAKLDADLYDEVEADRDAMGQAVGVVVLSSIAAGIGTITRGGFGGILFGTIFAIFGWYVWAYVTHLIGTKYLQEGERRPDFMTLLRIIGFSSSPGLIRVLGVIPGLTWIVFLIASIWMLIAMAIAVKQAFGHENTSRAFGVCLAGWIIQSVILLLLFSILGPRTS